MHQDASNELLKTTVLGGGSKVTHMTSRDPSQKPKTDLSTVSTQNERIQPGMVDLDTFCQLVSIYSWCFLFDIVSASDDSRC